MNWLAHVFLSELKVEQQIGNILADPLKGRAWDNASFDIHKGLFLHKKIDAFTDSHALVSKSKKCLREKGRLKPVIVDLSYDYLLTKNWDNFSHIPIEDFTSIFYKKTHKRLELMPQKANMVLSNLIKKDLLNKYQNLEQLKTSFERMDMRLSDRLLRKESASSYFEEVTYNIDKIEEDFLSFFPLLCEHIKPFMQKEKISHWKI